MKKSITRTSTRALAVLLALLLLAASVPLAVAECAHAHMQYFEAAPSDFCGSFGNIAYWRCDDCWSCFADREATTHLMYDDIWSVPPKYTDHDYLYDVGFEDEGNGNLWLSVRFESDLSSYKVYGMSYLDYQASQGITVTAKYCSHCGVVIREERDNGDGWTQVSSYHPDYYYHLETGATCAHEHIEQWYSTEDLSDVFCGKTEIKKHYYCEDCNRAFADEAATQPVTIDQLLLVSPNERHTFDYPVGFEDEGNGHVWLSTTSYREKECMEENGMTIAQKFASDGYTAKQCVNCGVVIEKDGQEQRAEDMGLFVNPIPELEGAVKVPLSPEGLEEGEKWFDFGSYVNTIMTGELSEDMLLGLALGLVSFGCCDFYYNETTQHIYFLENIFSTSIIQDFGESFGFIRTVGDDVTATALPSSSAGLTSGQKWFDAASFYQDVVAKLVSDDEYGTAIFENAMNSIATAEFYLNADGTNVFAKGHNATIEETVREITDDEEIHAMMQSIIHGGNWYVSLNGLLGTFEIAGVNALDYVKTVEGGACAHVWNGGTVTKNPNCTQAGIKTYTCTLCSEPREEIIPALGHNWDGGTVTKQPTMTDTGICTYACSRCTETKTTTVPRLDPMPLLDELKDKNDLKDTADDAAVFFDADANLPADTVFDYEILEQTKFYQIFDLTLTSGGKEVEPETPVWVKLPVPKGWNPNLITVWHGSEKLPSFVNGGYVYFYTSHFSEFQVKYDEGQGDDKPTTEPQTEPQANANACKLCGEVHTGILGALVGLLHRIIYFFKHLFG